MTTPIRFSIIDYLNALPLNMAFKDGRYDEQVALQFDYPSQCADNLAAGRADVGLISSIEYQRIPDLRVVPGVAIASQVRVRSVLILTKKDLADVSVVALDRFSRSSVALLRVLLHRRYGKRPFFTSMTPEPEKMLAEADAALVIGDAALKLPEGDFQVIDLATEWFRETSLPFVFAFWTMRNNVDAAKVSPLLAQARDYGIAQLPHRLQEIQARWKLEPQDALSYLTTNIHYHLGPEEEEGLKRFYQYAREAHLIEHIEPLRFAH